jgi:DNA-directed RNA polymerase omega subunit
MSEPKKGITTEDLEGIIDNKYLAVLIAAKRARKLNQGVLPSLKTNALKETTVALQELVAGKLDYVERKHPVEKRLDASSVFNLESAVEDEVEDEISDVQYVDDSDYEDQMEEDEIEEGL